MRKLVGYDLNGRSDLALRSWIERPGEDAETDGDIAVAGGTAGVVVAMEGDEDVPAGLVGGVQATLAPHGGGPGWGCIGAPWRRRSVRGLLSRLDRPQSRDADGLGAAFSAMAARPDIAVAAIPDDGSLGEIGQETLLRALHLAGARRALLVWRPVLLLLAGIGRWRAGDRALVISQTDAGFAAQDLSLKAGKVSAPERRRAGRLHVSGLGLDGLRARNPAIPPEPGAEDLVERALYEGGGRRLLRRSNGDWTALEIGLPPLPDEALPDSLRAEASEVDLVFLETPLADPLRGALHARVEAALGRPVHLAAPDAVARGGLDAARRLADGRPVYYDFLPQVRTIVEGYDRPESVDLVGRDELLPAGRLYRSPRPARFGLSPGMEEVVVHLDREGSPRPRRARLALRTAPTSRTTVELTLEQQPAAGRARLRLEAEDGSLRETVDWERAEELDIGWEELVASLERPRPPVPERMVIPAREDRWNGGQRDISGLLRSEARSMAPAWRILVAALRNARAGRRALDTDGRLPDHVAAETEAALDTLLVRAEETALLPLDRVPHDVNHALNFATWTFLRCPRSLVPRMLASLGVEAGAPGVPAGIHKTLLYQGLGRTVSEPEHMRRLFQHLHRLPDADWKSNQFACAASMLAMRDAAASLLDPAIADRLARLVASRLSALPPGKFGRAVHPLPQLLAGLLRTRVREPDALVLDRDPRAAPLAAGLDHVIGGLATLPALTASNTRALEILREVRAALEGRGGAANLLTRVFELDDDS